MTMRKIFCFGDSITLGESDVEGGGWTSRINRDLLADQQSALFQQITLYNLGIAGETTDGLKKRFSNECLARSVKKQKALVILQYGLNDIVIHKGKNRVPTNYFVRNLVYAVTNARAFSADCLLLNLTPISKANEGQIDQHGNLRFSDDVETFNQVVSRVAIDNGCDLINLHSSFTNDMKVKLLASDGVHPNSKGHEIIYHLVSDYLMSWLNPI